MNRRITLQTLLAAALTPLFAGCAKHQPAAQTTPLPAVPNALSEVEKRQGWVLLFDGRTLTGWHTYGKSPGLTPGWDVRDGAIVPTGSQGDLVSDLQFSSFELEIEWKISPNGNSGIFYWANEGTKVIYENAPEMQVLDNLGHPDGKSPLTSAGALYGLYPAAQDAVKAVGEWNLARIVIHGSKVQHWLNGVRTADVDFDSKEMKAKIAASKFKEWDTFGKSRRGHLGLQEHGGTVWFRSIKVREGR